MARRRRKPKHTKFPNINKLFGVIEEQIFQTAAEIIAEEAVKARDRLITFIWADKAQPEYPTPHYLMMRMRFGHLKINLIDTTTYVKSIDVHEHEPSHRGPRSFALRVGFPDKKVSPKGAGRWMIRKVMIRRLVKHGVSKKRRAVSFVKRRPSYRKKKYRPLLRDIALWQEYGTKDLPARPHWRPLMLWFRTERVPVVTRKIQRTAVRRIRAEFRKRKY